MKFEEKHRKSPLSILYWPKEVELLVSTVSKCAMTTFKITSNILALNILLTNTDSSFGIQRKEVYDDTFQKYTRASYEFWLNLKKLYILVL